MAYLAVGKVFFHKVQILSYLFPFSWFFCFFFLCLGSVFFSFRLLSLSLWLGKIMQNELGEEKMSLCLPYIHGNTLFLLKQPANLLLIIKTLHHYK